MFLAVIGVLEFYTFFNFYSYRPEKVPENFFAYMKTVKDTPGEAVMDWPFCIAGGNGVGTNLLGRFYHQNNAVSYMQRYHGKKVVGNYFGRLSMKQITPFLEAGWEKMFHPDTPNYFKARHQAVAMTEKEWAFFDNFYTLNDFCGINLYPALLAPGDEQKFYERFGEPLARSKVAGGLDVVFIAKDQKRRNMVDRLAGKKVVYWPFVEPGDTVDMVNPEFPPEIAAAGIFSLARNKLGLVRLAGNATELSFKSENKQAADLEMICYVKVPFTLLINNEEPTFITRNSKRNIPFEVQEGMNHIRIFSEETEGPSIAFKELKLKIQ